MRQSFGVIGALVLAGSAAWAADVHDLIKQLKDPDADVRRAAAKSLGEAGTEAKTAVPALIAALKDNDLFVRRFAAQSLGEIGPDAKAAVPALRALLQNDREKKEVQQAATTALGKLGTASVATLLATLKDTGKDVSVRRQAIESLAVLGADARAAIPLLTDTVNGKSAGKTPVNGDLRAEAATALGEIAGPDDKAVLDSLRSVSTDKKVRDRNLKKAAADALKKLESSK